MFNKINIVLIKVREHDGCNLLPVPMSVAGGVNFWNFQENSGLGQFKVLTLITPNLLQNYEQRLLFIYVANSIILWQLCFKVQVH